VPRSAPPGAHRPGLEDKIARPRDPPAGSLSPSASRRTQPLSIITFRADENIWAQNRDFAKRRRNAGSRAALKPARRRRTRIHAAQGRQALRFRGAGRAFLTSIIGTYLTSPRATALRNGAAGAGSGRECCITFRHHQAYHRRGSGRFDRTRRLDRRAAAQAGDEFGPPRAGRGAAAVRRRRAQALHPDQRGSACASTKLDVLDGMEEVKLCTGYRMAGTLVELLPAGAEERRL